MREGLPDDGLAVDDMVGALLDDPAVDRRAHNQVVVVRDGMRVRVVPDDVMPPGEPFDALSHDDAWFADAARVWETGEMPDPGPDWPPDAVPVFLWPEDVLRLALQGAPGPRLARVVAEAIDLAGDLDPHHDTHTDPGVLGGAPDDSDVPGAGALGAGPLADLSDDALGDLMVACGRLQSWSAGIQARVVAERAARESHPLAHNSLVGQVTTELVVTEPEATEVVVRAESGTQHPTVIQALLAGRIDVRKAHTLLRSAAQLTVAERAEAIQRYLPQAPRRTWKWLRNKMLAFAKNRHGAAATAKAETARRSVHVDRAENDMGWLSAYLPATDAAAVWGVVDDMAHQLRHGAGEDRTLSQLRADSLTGIITGRLLPADRLTHTDTDTETDTGTETGTDPGTDVDTGTGSGTAIAAEAGAGISDAASDTASDTASGEASDVASGEASGEASDAADTPVCTCGGKAPVVQQVVQEVVRPVRITPTRPVVRITIPATALLGLDNAPGDLAGYGPVPAEIARVIATDATWQRLLTDPITGILTDYSTTTYQPGKVLRAAIEARDETCTFGWCDTLASQCDLDHIEPFDHQRKNRDPGTGKPPGQTRAQNLQPLCRKHHLLKTHAGWGVVRDPETGITTWTTPTGRTHTRPPTVLDTHIDLDDIDPDTSHDLSIRTLTGQRLPRAYATTEPGSVPNQPNQPNQPDQPTDSTHATGQAQPDEPPF